MKIIEDIVSLFAQRGDSLYGGELISQRDHALQAATLAENENATPLLIVAALLHDIGHLVHDLPENASNQGVDDKHESVGEAYLESTFGDQVATPVRLHVSAKRYLCAADDDYLACLSEASQVCLLLQGGPFTVAEMNEFESLRYWRDAVRLRRWDDLAKVEGVVTPSIEHFKDYMRDILETQNS